MIRIVQSNEWMMAFIIMKKILLLQVNVIVISTFFTFFIVYANTYSDGNKHIDTGGGGSKIPSNHHHQQFPHDNDADDNEQNFSKSKYQPSNQRISYRQSNSNSTILTTKGKFSFLFNFFFSLSLSETKFILLNKKNVNFFLSLTGMIFLFNHSLSFFEQSICDDDNVTKVIYIWIPIRTLHHISSTLCV